MAKQKSKTELFFEMIRNDYQLDKNDDRFTGFLNTDPSNFGVFTDIALKVVANPEKYKDLMDKYDLSFEGQLPNKVEAVYHLKSHYQTT